MSRPKIEVVLYVLLLCFLVGCGKPFIYSNETLIKYDNHARYRIGENEKGFKIIVYYSRYQFIPESVGVKVACRNYVKRIADEIAEQKGKKLLPIDEQEIRISINRDDYTGITSCSARVSVKYES